MGYVEFVFVMYIYESVFIIKIFVILRKWGEEKCGKLLKFSEIVKS